MRKEYKVQHYTLKALATVCLMAAFVLGAQAQQVEEFALVRENAFVLNPAMAGTNGWIHGTATFRKQFTQLDQSPYTAMLAMDGQIFGKNVGVGGYLIHDQTGPTGKSGVTVSAAYNLRIFGKHEARASSGVAKHNLSFGLAVSAVQYRLRGDQLDVNDANDPGLYTSKGNKIFPDLSVGIYYRYKKNFYFGVSSPQLMGLNVNYQGNDGLAKIRKVQHLNVLVGGSIEFAKGKFSIDPVAAFRWVKNAPPQGDIGLRFNMLHRIFFIGANYRSINYAVVEAGFRWKEVFSLAYAYQHNTTNYSRDMGGTHEISVSFDIVRKQNIPVAKQLFNPRF